MPGILFTPEDGSDVSLQNCGLPQSIQYHIPEDKYASTVVVFRTVERNMSS
jgi:hypothetical protein